MLSFFHTLTSLPLGIYGHNPFLIFLAGVLLHLLMDSFTHWNIFPWKFKHYPYGWVALDILGGLAFAWWLLPDQFWTINMWAAIAGSNAPDVAHGLWEFTSQKTKDAYLNWLKPLFIFHDKIQRETTSPLHGMFWQIFWGTVVIIVIQWQIAS